MLKNYNLGNTVASDMIDILESKEYQNMFKQADTKKEEMCKCPKGCECRTKKGSHSKEECPCPEEKETSKKAQDTFKDLVLAFTSLSEKLDDLGFEKAAASVLTSFDVLISEAEGEPIEELIEESLEESLEMLTPGLDVEIDLKGPVDVETMAPQADPDLLEEDPSELMSIEEQIRAIEEMGELGELDETTPLTQDEKEGLKDRGLDWLSQEIAEASTEVDNWLNKNADDDFESFDLDAELDAFANSLDDELFSLAEEEDKDEKEEEDKSDADDKDDEDKDEEFEDEE